MNQSPENILRALLMMPHLLRMICVFCTEKQVSTRQFHQFYILTKISVEICLRFVYNAFIGVIAHLTARRGENTFPKGDLIYHVHRQFYS